MAQKTVEEIKALEAAPLNEGEESVEEDLEPPIVRKRLREELQCNESELTKFLAILDEKARKMQEKLSIKEGDDDEDKDEKELENNGEDEEDPETKVI